MKKVTSLLALCALATAANGQSFIAGLNFDSAPDVSADVAFDKGSDAGLFTLNVQTNAEDNLTLFGSFTETGWAAIGDIYTDGSNNVPVPTPGFDATVQNVVGQTASTDLFGGTSANAQGFSDTFGISFGANTDGFFTIGVAQDIENLSLSFDVFADAGQSQTAGTLLVNGQAVSVTSASANQVVNLGNVSAGLITFDLTGLDNGASFDNFMVSVPEPSTYAVLAGVLALATAVVRRRR